MTTIADSIALADGLVPEEAAIADARERAIEVGCRPIGAGAGAALRMLAAAINARAIVEVGGGTGVSGLWLLGGLASGGVLTSIDTESEHQRLARRAFAEAGTTGRVRLINGRAGDVLPRLADTSYDLVLVDADPPRAPEYVRQALRLLRPGGLVAINNAFADGDTADTAVHEPAAIAMRETNQLIISDERLVPALLPVGDGLTVALLRDVSP